MANIGLQCQGKIPQCPADSLFISQHHAAWKHDPAQKDGSGGAEPARLLHAPQGIKHLLRRHGEHIEIPDDAVAFIAFHKTGHIHEAGAPEDVDDVQTASQQAAGFADGAAGRLPAYRPAKIVAAVRPGGRVHRLPALKAMLYRDVSR